MRGEERAGTCACVGRQTCDACQEWERTHRPPKRGYGGRPTHIRCSAKCPQHIRFRAGCVACQAANRAYYKIYRRLQRPEQWY
jgi:hypothetical protein